MTTPDPAQPQPREIALEQATPDQVEQLEEASEPEQPAGPDGA